jgi:hypothetical protein
MAGRRVIYRECADCRTMETGGMATILEFRRTGEPAPRDEARADSSLGQVIIFPGVRIERRAEGGPGGAATPPRKRAPRGRKRQRR